MGLAFEVRTTDVAHFQRRPPLSLAMHSGQLSTSHFFTVDVEEYFQVKALESVVRRDEWLSRPSRVAHIFLRRV